MSPMRLSRSAQTKLSQWVQPKAQSAQGRHKNGYSHMSLILAFV
jgi:hypothetical protein